MTWLADIWRDHLVGREVELLARLGIDWPQRGQRHIRCPFPDHEDRHPSWRWDAERRAWFCTCGRGGGDLILAVMRMKGCDFKEAVRWVEAELGIRRRSTGSRRRR
jgi:hypothetical protein